MKKKIIFAIATGFFAVATVLNMNMLQANSAGDVSLESIAVMAQAGYENELPEVEIICDANPGRCWAEGEPKRIWTPFGASLCETTCVFTGWQSDYCISGMPTPC